MTKYCGTTESLTEIVLVAASINDGTRQRNIHNFLPQMLSTESYSTNNMIDSYGAGGSEGIRDSDGAYEGAGVVGVNEGLIVGEKVGVSVAFALFPPLDLLDPLPPLPVFCEVRVERIVEMRN